MLVSYRPVRDESLTAQRLKRQTFFSQQHRLCGCKIRKWLGWATREAAIKPSASDSVVGQNSAKTTRLAPLARRSHYLSDPQPLTTKVSDRAADNVGPPR